MVGAIAIGIKAGSFALLAFGGVSLIEFISGLAVLGDLRRNGRGSEGHNTERTERIGTVLLSALITVIGLGSVYSFFSGVRAEASPLGIILAIGAIIMMPYLWFQKNRIGGETRFVPLKIDAVASLTCVLMAIALLGGLLTEFFFGIWWIDYVATAVILAFVGKEAIESLRELRDKDRSFRTPS